ATRARWRQGKRRLICVSVVCPARRRAVRREVVDGGSHLNTYRKEAVGAESVFEFGVQVGCDHGAGSGVGDGTEIDVIGCVEAENEACCTPDDAWGLCVADACETPLSVRADWMRAGPSLT